MIITLKNKTGGYTKYHMNWYEYLGEIRNYNNDNN